MTVKEAVNSLRVNGTIKVFNTRSKMYERADKNLDKEVKEVTYHKGYGYNQVNAVVRF